jgi:hypothetical protein
MMPALAALDRIVRQALSGGGCGGGAVVTPHVAACAARRGAGLTAAVEVFARAPDPVEGSRAVRSEMARLAHGLQRKRDLRLRNLSPALAAIGVGVGVGVSSAASSSYSSSAAPMPGAANLLRGHTFAAASHAAKTANTANASNPGVSRWHRRRRRRWCPWASG